MKLTPLSIAVRMMRVANSSSMYLKPRCQPPRPIRETFTPDWPSVRTGISEFDPVCDIVSTLYNLLFDDVVLQCRNKRENLTFFFLRHFELIERRGEMFSRGVPVGVCNAESRM